MAKDIQVRRDSDLSSPFDLMPEFERLAERFLGDRFGSIFGDLPTLPRRANLDVRETDKSYILTADVPGIPKENIDISVDGNVLTVRAEHKVEGGRDERHEFRRQYRSFQQSLTRQWPARGLDT